jgi:cell division protein ZapA
MRKTRSLLVDGIWNFEIRCAGLMGEVDLTINNRSFKLGCDDGEEQHLLLLAEHLGQHVDNLRKTIGNAGDEQLYLMAGLMVCDELWDARDLLIKAEEMLKRQVASKAVSPPPSGQELPQDPASLTKQTSADGQVKQAASSEQTDPLAAAMPSMASPRDSDPKET